MSENDRYDTLFQWYAKLYSIEPWQLLKAQVKKESSFQPWVLAEDGGMGLAQFMPATFAEWAVKLKIRNPNAYNPEHSIQCQAAYMRWLLDQFPELDKALAAYNFGIGKVRAGTPWPILTRVYVNQIKNYLKEYLDQDGRRQDVV